MQATHEKHAPAAHQPTGVEATTASILFAVRKEAQGWHLKYADVVRAITNALVAINEEHREKTGE